MNIIDLSYFILQLNHLIDADLHRSVTFEEAKKHIKHGDLFEWLDKRFDGEIDIKHLSQSGAAQKITLELQNLLGGYDGSERRKWRLKNNGICLILGWTNELIQQAYAKQQKLI